MAYTTINKHTDHFNTKLYTGNGGTNAITGVGFQPDLVWIKDRDATGYHFWTDAVRGVTKTIFSNRDDATSTEATGLTAFGTDGFTVGSHSNINTSGRNIASWNWKAGTGAGSSNTDGSINTTYTSVNTTAGFSIVSWTGTGSAGTIGHGLGVKPAMIISKNRDEAQNWFCYHTGLGATKYIRLNLTNEFGTSSAIWNDTEPTTSLFSVGNDTAVNGSSDEMIAYCFAEKKGYSKFGSYKGNGNADGPFVYLGFKPALVIIKGAVSGDGDAAQNWELYDNKRDGRNGLNDALFPNTTAAESVEDRVDLLSNGFKIRVNSDGVNDNNSTYIYMAFGQSLVGSNNVPCTAR